ncbi:MAG TPA: hypothetical protein VKE27_12650 [Candidatus Dormibacteraeota bacterium]|nr:hypothetical protein [Candidatus Dormibacteraeota bacterium]
MRSSPPDPSPSPVLRWLPYLFAAGAIFWLVNLTQAAALAAAPVGRAQLEQTLANAGLTQNAPALLAVYFVVVLVFEGTAAGLHGAAFYGLRGRRWWGWVVAVIVAGAWSLVLVGIPVLVFLLQRQTRQAYGVL